jgi:hypothetical protein
MGHVATIMLAVMLLALGASAGYYATIDEGSPEAIVEIIEVEVEVEKIVEVEVEVEKIVEVEVEVEKIVEVEVKIEKIVEVFEPQTLVTAINLYPGTTVTISLFPINQVVEECEIVILEKPDWMDSTLYGELPMEWGEIITYHIIFEVYSQGHLRYTVEYHIVSNPGG